MNTKQIIAKQKLDELNDKKHYCSQCGKDLGFEWFLGSVCLECCHKNHRKVCGK